jgi:hypothetical protein
MAFGMNLFNKKEAPKKDLSKESSLAESAKNLAGDAAKLSAAAILLAGALDSSDAFSAEKMDKDQTPVNKIEMSATQSTPKAMESAISFEDARKMHQIDSLENVKDSLLDKKHDFEMKFQIVSDRYLTITKKVLEKMDKDQRKYHEAALDLPAHFKEFNDLSMKSAKGEILSSTEKQRMEDLRGMIKNETGLMAHLSGPGMESVFSELTREGTVTSKDIDLHTEYGSIREKMMGALINERKMDTGVDKQEDLIAQLQSELDSSQLTASK